MNMRSRFICTILLVILIATGINAQNFKDIDNYVLSLNLGRNLSKEEIALTVTKNAFTKKEKARAIFVWLADNIAYDTDFKIYDADNALKYRKSVCQGYSELYADMCSAVGVNVITASGKSKWFNYKINDRLGDHAWSLVEVDDGGYIIVDVTWGAGNVNGQTFTKELKDYWFDADPHLFIFSHFPDDTQHQLIEIPISMELFKRLPGITPVLSDMGIDGTTFLKYFRDNNNAWFPIIYGAASVSGIKIQQMPYAKTLKRDSIYEFQFTASPNSKMAIINNGEFTFIEHGKPIQYTPSESGRLSIAIKMAGDDSYSSIFGYDVK